MKTNFTLLIFSLLCLFSVNAFAHTGSIKGKITDVTNSKPIDGASIFLKGSNASTITDVFGSFFIKDIKDGKYIVTISHLGYETIQQELKIEDGITAELNIPLKPSNIDLKSVTINARKDLVHSSVSSIDMKYRPINTSQDMLRMVPGLFIAQHQGGGKAEQMFLRGFDIDHGTDVNVSVDGIPVNMVSHAHGQGYADLHFLLPEIVEKLDFGKGPYEVDRGNMATAGWVSFTTKNALENNFIKLEGGNFGHQRSVIGLNLSDKADQSAYVAAEYAFDRGYFDAPQNFNRVNMTGKYTSRFAGNKMLSVTLSGFRSNWNASGQIPGRAVEEGIIGRFGEIDKENGKTSRYNFNLQYTEAIGNRSVFKSNLYASYYDFELYSNFTFYLNDSVNGDQIRQKESRILAGYNASYTTHATIAGLKAKTEIGAGLRFDNSMNNELSHTANETVTLEKLSYGDIYETNPYGYAKGTLYLLPRLGITGGTRFDYFIHSYRNKLVNNQYVKSSYSANTFSPKAGLFYNFNDKARLYFNYGTGFHTNDTRVVVAQQAKEILPLAFSYDLGLVVKPFSKLLISAAAWRLDLQQEFVYVGDEAVVELSGPTRRYGADLSVRYQLLKWLYADADLNYTHGRSLNAEQGEDHIPLAPTLTSIGGLTVTFNNGISASLRYRHMGNRPANEDNSVIAKGYTVTDAVLSYSRKKYELGMQVQNVFNIQWNEAQFDTETRLKNEAAPVSELCFTPGTPLAVKFTASYRF